LGRGLRKIEGIFLGEGGSCGGKGQESGTTMLGGGGGCLGGGAEGSKEYLGKGRTCTTEKKPGLVASGKVQQKSFKGIKKVRLPKTRH